MVKEKIALKAVLRKQKLKNELYPLSIKYKLIQFIQNLQIQLFFDGQNWNISELKAGGDLDSSNAPSNVEKLLTIYVDMGITNCNAYFVALYNKNGEGNTWTGSVKKHLNYPSMFLIGSNFWNKILPNDIDFYTFEQIYHDALVELNLNEHINTLINKIIKD